MVPQTAAPSLPGAPRNRVKLKLDIIVNKQMSSQGMNLSRVAGLREPDTQGAASCCRPCGFPSLQLVRVGLARDPGNSSNL